MVYRVFKEWLHVLLLMAGITMLPAQMRFEVGLGIDLPGTHKSEDNVNGTDKPDTDLDFSPSFEALYEVMPNLLTGLGVEYQIPRGADGDWADDPKFSFIPLYLTARYDVPTQLPVTPELIL